MGIKTIWNILGSSIYAKLLSAFLTVIIPLFALSLTINEWSSKNVKDEILASMVSRLNFSVDSLEAEINRIVTLQKEYLNDDDLMNISNKYEVMSPYEQTQSVTRLQKRFLLMKNSSPYIVDSGVYIRSIGKSVSANELYAEVGEDEIEDLRDSYETSRTDVLWYKDSPCLVIPYPEYSPGRMPLFILRTGLSVDEIRNALDRVSKSEYGGAILVSNTGDWFIGTVKDPDITTEILEYPVFHKGYEDSAVRDSIVIKGKKYLITYRTANVLNAVLLYCIPESDVLGKLNMYRTWFWAILFISLFIVSVFSYWIYRLIHQPLKRMVSAFDKVEKGGFDALIERKSADEFGYLFTQFNKMVNHLRKLIHEVYENKILSQKSELKFLQSQINPHFLYNSFLLLSSMARIKDLENINRLTRHLGDYFRFITHDSNGMVTLEHEMEHVKNYMEIQKLRFADRIHVRFDERLPENIKALRVPRLIIQPIVENVYNHGLKNKAAGGEMDITINAGSNRLEICVEDNGDELTDDKLKALQEVLIERENNGILTGTGLVNVHRRLKLTFGNDSGLSLERSRLGGMKVLLAIKLPS